MSEIRKNVRLRFLFNMDLSHYPGTRIARISDLFNINSLLLMSTVDRIKGKLKDTLN